MKQDKVMDMKRTIANHRLSIALFSVLGLLAWVLFANYVDMGSEIREILFSPWAPLFMVILFNILGLFSIKTSLWLNNQYMLNASKKWKIVMAYVGVMAIYFVLIYGFLVTAKLLADVPQPFIFPNGGTRILVIVWFVEMIVLGLLLSNIAMEQNFRYQRRMDKLQEETMAARCSALQDQLNPHFLFNSFNTLVAEIEYNPKNAVLFTRKLSDVYRYVLQVQKKKLVPLEEEIAFMSAYLYLHEVRLGKCIHCEISGLDDHLDYRLPPLALQLLLENVVKHNSISASFPMRISLTVEDDWLVVTNTLRPRTSQESTGVGLANLSNRCKMILGKDLQIQRTKDCFTVKIPLQYE